MLARSLRDLMLSIALATGVLAGSTADLAQAQRDWSEGDASRGGHVAGEFDDYALVLSWSPTHCASPAGDDDDTQCARPDGRRYSFILHGLWPQYVRGWPESCRTRRKPFVPEDVIQSMMDIMPSRGLIIHEYRKHGTCSGLDVARYFDLSRRLFQSIAIPERYLNPQELQLVSPDGFIRDMVRANPTLKPDMMAVSCAGRDNRLRELRICYSKDGKPQHCGPNQDQRRLCSAREMSVPPVRSRFDPPQKTPRGVIDWNNPLPGPR
ncbi:MAG: ribonuclease T [Hyphomicrobium sp.]|nr:ribonuclease T [Hyphomicrobium sp.]